MELSVAALTNGLCSFDFWAFWMWPIVDDVTSLGSNLTLIGSGPITVGWMGNPYKLYLKFGGAHLVPRKTLTKTGSGTKYKINNSTYIHTWHGIN